MSNLRPDEVAPDWDALEREAEKLKPCPLKDALWDLDSGHGAAAITTILGEAQETHTTLIGAIAAGRRESARLEEARRDLEASQALCTDAIATVDKQRKQIENLERDLSQARQDLDQNAADVMRLQGELAEARQAGGHAQNCGCCTRRIVNDPPLALCPTCGQHQEEHPYRDPRCAPATAPSPHPDWAQIGLRCGHTMAEWVFEDEETGAGHCGVCARKAGEADEKVKRAHEAVDGMDCAWRQRPDTLEGLEAMDSYRDDAHAAIDAIPVADPDDANLIHLTRDREWSNRLESQDTVHPDSPDLDAVIAWYVHRHKPVAKAPEPGEVEEAHAKLKDAIRDFGCRSQDAGKHSQKRAIALGLADRLASLARRGEMPGEDTLTGLILAEYGSAIHSDFPQRMRDVARWCLSHFRDYRAEGWPK